MSDLRRPAPTSLPVVLTIAGSDSGGGAGIQADLKTIEATGGFGASAITAVTAQNTTAVESSYVLPTEEIDAQLRAVSSDFDVAAIKTGMLATGEVIDTVTDHVRSIDAPVVVDPVMIAATGDRLLSADAEAAYESLIAEATLVTPNTDEAAVLTGVEPTDETGARAAGERLLEAGADAALIKGGHMPGADVVDTLVTADGVETARHPRVDTDATHGSGCTVSAAIATRLALGDSLTDAVQYGVAFMGRAVRYHHDVGAGPGAVHHVVALRNEAARNDTAELVSGVVERLADHGVRSLVPEVGMNVVGATPYAESTDEVAAVEGRIAKTRSGIAPNRGVRFGASSHVARFLLGAREFHPELRFAINCRFDDAVEAALETLGWDVVEYDRDDEPDDAPGTMPWAARQAFDRPSAPTAVVDRGAVGKEPMTRIVDADADVLAERALALAEALD